MKKNNTNQNSKIYPSFSIIIPLFNEEDSINSLLIDLTNSLSFFSSYQYEIIIVDDGSHDNSKLIIDKFIEKNDIIIRYLKLNINSGQSVAILNGINISIYNIIVTIDADGQNNPADIPRLLDIYNNNDYSLVGGLRLKRKDNFKKIISSKIANKIRKMILNDDCDDTGCSLKVFDKNIFLKLPFFNGIHRFLPALFKASGCKLFFIQVDHRRRVYGVSKYGTVDRLFKGIKDLFIVLKFIKKIKKND